MPANIFIFSTLTSDQIYAMWSPPPAGGVARIERQVKIKGGANVASKLLVTPVGVRTQVTEEELDLLEKNHTFNRHVAGGFIQVRKDKVDPEVAVAADMEQRDKSAPYTPESPEFAESGAKPMKSSKKDAPVEARAEG